MKKIHYLILLCFTALCFIACNDDEPEFSGIEGKDRFISDFVLTVAGTTYQGMIAGDTITIEIPYNTSLKGATAAYTLSEGASINPIHRPYRIGRMNGNLLLPPKCRRAKCILILTDIPTSGRAAA